MKAGEDVYGFFAIENVIIAPRRSNESVKWVGYVVIDLRTGFIHYYSDKLQDYIICKKVIISLMKETRLTY